MTDREEFYDSDIAPALAKVQEMCRDAGLSMFAAVSFNDEGEIGRTNCIQPNAPSMIRWIDAMGQCWCDGGTINLDKFMFAVMKDAREKGHSSVILTQLGVPATPKS